MTFTDHVFQSVLTAEEKAQQLERILDAEEKRFAAIQKEMAGLRDLQFKQQERIHDLKHEEQVALTTIQC